VVELIAINWLKVRKEDRVDVALFHGEIVGVPPIHLKFINSFATSVTSSSRSWSCSWSGAFARVLEVANKFRMNTNGPTDDVRGILGERSGLVSANDGSVGHRLTGTQDTNEAVIRFVVKASASVTLQLPLVTGKSRSLDCSTVGDSLIGVDALAGLLSVEVRNELYDTRNTCRTTDQYNLVDIGLVDLDVTEDLLDRVEGASEEVLAQLLKTSMSERRVEIDTLDEGIDFNVPQWPLHPPHLPSPTRQWRHYGHCRRRHSSFGVLPFETRFVEDGVDELRNGWDNEGARGRRPGMPEYLGVTKREGCVLITRLRL